MTFRVRRVSDGAILPGFPSPFLIDQGGGDAYTETPDAERPYWYARVDGKYESPDGKYERVRIEHAEDWRVDVTITPVGPDGPEPADDDYFIVEAATEPEAFRLAMTAAHEYVQNMFGDDYASDVTIIRARKGVSI